MATAMGNLQDVFHAFLLSMSPEELTGLVARLQTARDSVIRSAQVPNGNISTRHLTADSGRGVRPNPAPRTSVLRGGRPLDRKRRPLNSFIAFRSFYSVLFPDITQKARSGILKFLWQNDPFKAKWAILAKAYSIIRDDHDGEVSLDQFLGLNTSFIRIIEPKRYLEMMGWELSIDEEQQYTMAKVKNVTALDAEVATNYSVDDIVKHCYNAGLVFEAQRAHPKHPSDNGSIMAFATQPNIIIRKNDDVEISGSNNVVHANPHSSPAVEVPAIALESVVSTPSSNVLDPMIRSTQITERCDVLPDQSNPMFQGLHNLSFDNMQSPDVDSCCVGIDDLYRYQAEAPNPGDTFDRVEFDQYLNFF